MFYGHDASARLYSKDAGSFQTLQLPLTQTAYAHAKMSWLRVEKMVLVKLMPTVNGSSSQEPEGKNDCASWERT
jgi:hypothetical protein